MSSIAVYSPKGGAGKSTLAVNLAHLSATSSKRRTLLWDIDAQGAAGFLLGVEPRGAQAHKVISRDAEPRDLAVPSPYPNLDVLAADASLRRLDVQFAEADARKRLRKILKSLGDRYERIVVDCPPGLTEISEQVFRAVDLIVLPVQPSRLGVRGYDEAVAHIRSNHPDGPEILPALSMVDGRRKLHREMVAAHPEWPAIPQASVVERMSVERAPLAAFAPRSAATTAFRELWAAVERRLAEAAPAGRAVAHA